MNAVHFRYLSGGILLAVHVVAIAMIANSNRFNDTADQISSILMLVPVTIVYVLAFLKYVVANATEDEGNEAPFNRMATAVMLSIVLIFSAGILFVVVKFVFYSAYRVEEFKMWLGVVETGFGALIGLVFERLFGVKIERAREPAGG